MNSSLPDPDANQPLPIAGDPRRTAAAAADLGSLAKQDMNPALVLSEGARLHWASLFFDILSHVWSYLIPIGLALLGAAKGDLFWTVIAGLFFCLSLSRSIFRYFTLRYSIANRQLNVTQGFIFRSVRTVPVARIQNIDLTQNILHRLLKVAEVRIETAAGPEPEAVLRVLAMAQIERLRNEIFSVQAEAGLVNPTQGGVAGLVAAKSDTSRLSVLGHDSELTASEGLLDDTVGQQNESVKGEHDSHQASFGPGFGSGREEPAIIEIPIRWLLIGGVASNRGLIMVGVLMGVAYQIANQTNYLDEIDVRAIQRWIPTDLDRISLLIGAAVGFLLLSIGLKILGSIWYVLRFFGYRLTRRGDDLRIVCGFFTRVSATIPRPRIQFVSIQQTWIARWLGFCSIQIETAGGDRNQASGKSVSGRWFLPVLPVSEVPRVMRELRPSINHWSPESLDWQPLAAKAFRRMLRRGFLQAILVAGLGLYFFFPWGSVAGLIALPLIAIWLRAKSKKVCYARFDQGVMHRYGVLNRRLNLTFFEKIQGISVSHSPFDRRWGMATLALDTAGSGPAESAIVIPLLNEDFAKREQAVLTSLAAQHQPSYQ